MATSGIVSPFIQTQPTTQRHNVVEPSSSNGHHHHDITGESSINRNILFRQSTGNHAELLLQQQLPIVDCRAKVDTDSHQTFFPTASSSQVPPLIESVSNQITADQFDCSQSGNGLAPSNINGGFTGLTDINPNPPSESGQSMLGSPIQNGHASKQTMLLLIRLLMSGKEVGSIIGKRGENVKRYREESGARINISDGSSPERIVTVTGFTEQIFVAFTLMSQKFEDDFTQSLLRMTDDEAVPCPPVTLRLLVPASQCGSIIGKGGCRIKDVRELTGASIQVASEALPASTERTVTISGTAKAISNCIRHLCDIFIESPSKGPLILYRPKPSFNGTNGNSNPVVCPTSPYPTNLIAQSLPFGIPSQQSCGSEQGLNFLYQTQQQTDVVNGAGPTPTPSYINPLSLQAANLTNLTVNGSSGMARGSYTGDPSTDQVQLNNLLACADLASLQNNSASLFLQPVNAAGISNPLFNPATNNQFGLSAHGLCGFLGLPPPILTTTQSNDGQTSTMDSRLSNSTPTPDSSGAINNSETGQSNSLVAANPNIVGVGSTSLNLPYNYPTKPFWSLAAQPSHNPSQYPTNMLTGNFIASTPSTPAPLESPLPISMMETGYQTTPNHSNESSSVCQELILSNELIGCIIGRGGTTINEIRNLSKAHIKISNCEDATKQRRITLCGSREAVNMAYMLMNNSIHKSQNTLLGKLHQATLATHLMTTTGSAKLGQTICQYQRGTNDGAEEEVTALAKQIVNQIYKHDHPLNNIGESKTTLNDMAYFQAAEPVLNKITNQVPVTPTTPHRRMERLLSRMRTAPYLHRRES